MNEITSTAIETGGPVPPGLAKQKQVRKFLRIAGPLTLLVGLVCVGIATASAFGAFESNSFGPPRLFWLSFVGLPLIFVGGVMTGTGFLGAVLRFQAGEAAPVAVDTANYMVGETKDAIKTASKAVAEGVVEGIKAARTSQCVGGKD